MESYIENVVEEMEDADSSKEFENAVLDRDYELERELESWPSTDTDHYEVTSPDGYGCNVYWDDQQVQTLMTQF